MNVSKNALSFEEFSERGEWLCQQSFIAGWLDRLKWPALDVVDDELMTRTRSTSRFAEFNNVFTTRVSRTNLNRDVARCLETLIEEGLPTKWYLSGDYANAIVTEQLTSLGFEEVERYTIMATHLGQGLGEQTNVGNKQAIPTPQQGEPEFSRSSPHDPSEKSRPKQAPYDTSFGLVSDGATLKKWTETLARITGYSKQLEADWLDMLLCGGFGVDQAWRQYYCKNNGKIVGVLSAFWTEQLVSIEMVGVLRTYRNNCIGAQLLKFALDDAFSAGYDVASAYPTDYLLDFFRKNSFEKIGTIDCVAIGTAEQGLNKKPSKSVGFSEIALPGNFDDFPTRRHN